MSAKGGKIAEVENRSIIPGGRYHFDQSDPIFADHFPGLPVIPGSLLLCCFQKAAESEAVRLNHLNVKLANIRNARFIHFGRPGNVEVELEVIESQVEVLCFSCIAVQNDNTLASALLYYEKP
jgi:3-hydroxyacyl-[acyl-carrier-protein] dehydratase